MTELATQGPEKWKKSVPQKIASRINTKNDKFQKLKDRNQKPSTAMNR